MTEGYFYALKCLRLPLRTPGSVLFSGGLHVLPLLRLVFKDLHQFFYDIDIELVGQCISSFVFYIGIYRMTSVFQGAFATDLACQQGALTLPDISYVPLLDLLMLQLLRPDFSTLPCPYTTFHLEHTSAIPRCSFGVTFQL